jgi:hypothetical protein
MIDEKKAENKMIRFDNKKNKARDKRRRKNERAKS